MDCLTCKTILKLIFFKRFSTPRFSLYDHHQVLELLWCTNCCAHCDPIFVTGVSLGAEPLSPCFVFVLLWLIITHRQHRDMVHHQGIHQSHIQDHTRNKTKWSQQLLYHESLTLMMFIGAATCSAELLKNVKYIAVHRLHSIVSDMQQNTEMQYCNFPKKFLPFKIERLTLNSATLTACWYC